MQTSLLETVKVSAYASLWFSWVAVLIASIPTLLVAANVSRARRSCYLIAGLLGAIAGGSCGTTSLFLSLWFFCRNHPGCNTAQGDMGLIVTLPVGSLAGCLLSLLWTHSIRGVLKLSSESEGSLSAIRLRKWTCVVVIPAGFWVLVTLIAAYLMA